MPILETDTDLRRLLRGAKTVAVVGLSANPARVSHGIAVFLQNSGYRILPVNPSIRSVLGEASAPGLEHLREQVDIVDVFRRPEHVPEVVEAAIRIGARAVWMQPGVGHGGAARRASDAGLDVVVDRCILVEHRRLIH